MGGGGRRSGVFAAGLEISEMRALGLLWVWVVGLVVEVEEEMDSLRRMMERGRDWRSEIATRVEAGDSAIVVIRCMVSGHGYGNN